jgi:hypothetical protein
VTSGASTALNDAIRQELLSVNVAKWVEMPPAVRPRAQAWTPERVAHWKATGQVPSPVMVWTPEQTGQFLDHAMGDRLLSAVAPGRAPWAAPG